MSMLSVRARQEHYAQTQPCKQLASQASQTDRHKEKDTERGRQWGLEGRELASTRTCERARSLLCVHRPTELLVGCSPNSSSLYMPVYNQQYPAGFHVVSTLVFRRYTHKQEKRFETALSLSRVGAISLLFSILPTFKRRLKTHLGLFD